ncbi:hypothetical protein ABQF35_14495 [Mycobacterium syngnathidarum]
MTAAMLRRLLALMLYGGMLAGTGTCWVTDAKALADEPAWLPTGSVVVR